MLYLCAELLMADFGLSYFDAMHQQTPVPYDAYKSDALTEDVAAG